MVSRTVSHVLVQPAYGAGVEHATSPTCVNQFQNKLDKFWQRHGH